MLTVVVIFVVALAPSLFSAWVLRRADSSFQERLQSVTTRITARSRRNIYYSSDQHYVEGIGFIVGDLTCKFNARSRYIRCAVNPLGPCEGCFFHEPKELQDSFNQH